ncbi:hypothetical protein UlMin_012437 [Ulmus minor]
MDRSWISNPDRISAEYVAGVNQFLQIARETVDATGCTLCPCKNCINRVKRHIGEIRRHLLHQGFLSTYTVWVEHGEVDHSEEQAHESFADEMEEAFHDATRDQYFDICSTSDMLSPEQPADSERYDNLSDQLKTPLYDGCNDTISALTFVVKLMHLKVLNKWTDRSFDMLIKLLQEVLPAGNRCPDSYYSTRKMLCDVGLGYEQIDVCKYDCSLFYGEYSADQDCHVCGTSRYIRKKIPHKRLRYFPITPRLKRLYSSKSTATLMRWHKKGRVVEPGVLRHPANGEAWQNFDLLNEHFASDPRSIRLGLAFDGFNPFGNMSTTYSMWPVVLIPYNLPPWKIAVKTNYMLSLLIPGPKSPTKDFDVFMRPLIDELKLLWNVGTDCFDAHEGKMFKLFASVIWTVSDFPAYAYFSGWSTQGKLACPVCLEDTRHMSIRGKQCYMGHQCFLEAKHPWRNRKDFDGTIKVRPPPHRFESSHILAQLDAISPRQPGKAPSNLSWKRKRLSSELNWLKKSILFELAYWSSLKLRHNLDVMHIEKNVCDDIVGTLMDIEGKTNDTLKARMDLKDLDYRHELHLDLDGKRKPFASYTFTKEECRGFCEYIKAVKLPDEFVSNIGHCVIENYKLSGMKTHHCHILLQKLLPAGIISFLTEPVRKTLIEFCQFFEKLCARTLRVDELREMQRSIILILCKLEKIYPPAFFTIMVHLCVHLPEQAILGGPVQYRWMYGTERLQPDGSIAEAYVIDEVLTFLSRYMTNIETRFNRTERNWDNSTLNSVHVLDVFSAQFRSLGANELKELGDQRRKVHWYIVNNSFDETVRNYIDEHKSNLLAAGYSINELHIAQEEQFLGWFHDKVALQKQANPSTITEDLYSLAVGPEERYFSQEACVVNGIRFRSTVHDGLRTQCSGILNLAEHDGIDHMFYGVILEVMEVVYIRGRKVLVFRCQWFELMPNSNSIFDQYNMTSINIKSSWYEDQSYILATQARQVFYLPNLERGDNWKIIQKVSHRHLYDISVSTVDDIDENTIDDNDDDDEILPPLQLNTTHVEPLSLVRHDIAPIHFPDQFFVELNILGPKLLHNDHSDGDENEDSVHTDDDNIS